MSSIDGDGLDHGRIVRHRHGDRARDRAAREETLVLVARRIIKLDELAASW